MIIPVNPNIGDTMTIAGKEYIYNGTGWVLDEITIPVKATPISSDQVVLQDSEDANSYKLAELNKLPISEDVLVYINGTNPTEV